MIINNTYKFIFIHIPKNAGTSISIFFSQFTNWCDIEIGATKYGQMLQKVFNERFGLRKHATAQEIIKVIGVEKFNSYFKFAFVRNPYRRLYSIYNFLKKWKNIPQEWKEYMDNFNSFEEFVIAEAFAKEKGPDTIFLPQYKWVTINSKIAVDFIGKVENIEEDIKKILRNLNLKSSENLPIVNISVNQVNPSDFENPKVVDKIYYFYKGDFELFDYPKDVEYIFYKK